MKENKIIFELLREDKDKNEDNNRVYTTYNELINILKNCINNPSALNDIKDKLDIIIDTDIKEFITFMISFLGSGITINNDEINDKINEYVIKLENERNTRKEVIECRENIKNIEKLLSIINNGYSDDIEPLIDYIRNCYNDERIDFSTYVNLNMYLLVQKSSFYKKSELYDNTTDNVILEENDAETRKNIRESLITLFKDKGFDYDLIEEMYKDKIETFSKIENVTKVLDFLKKYKLSPNKISVFQIIIADLFIYFDEDAINRVDIFLVNNPNTSLDTLLRMSSIFFDRKKDFKEKTRDGRIIKDGHGKVIVGNSKDFPVNVELYKKLLGKDESYSMSDEDFIDREVFFSTPNVVLVRNLTLFRLYGIVSLDSNGELIDKEAFNRNSSCFVARNTEFILDRCIESNLYNYIKKYRTILNRSSSLLMWYKIKRAYSLGDNIRFNDSDLSTSRLKGIFTDDEWSYNGISRVVRTDDRGYDINQEVMSMEDLVRGNKSYPIPQGIPEFYAEKEFSYFYKYKVYDANDIVDIVRRRNFIANFNYFKDKMSSVDDVLKNYYSRDKGKAFNNDIFFDPFITVLDNGKNLNSHININKSSNGLAYKINVVSNGWPDLNIVISRPKVLKICNLLKKENLWFDERSSYDEIVALILVSLTKDTVLSEFEMNTLKYVSRVIAGKLVSSKEKIKEL